MNNEKEIEEMAKVLFESGVALDATDFAFGVDGDDHFTRLAVKLVACGYGNVKQAVKEFAERFKKEFLKHFPTLFTDAIYQCTDSELDDLISELYEEDKRKT